MRFFKSFAYLLATSAAFISTANACTDFLITAKDGTHVNGRSMEFAAPLNTAITTYPKQQERQSTAPNNQKGLKWTSKYGFVAATTLGLDFPVDGINDQGLSIGFLWLPGTEYEPIPSEQSNKALFLGDFGTWLLGNFATIEEVKKALPEVLVWCPPMPELNHTIPPIHLTIHDASGKSLAVEFIKGKKQIHDNPIHVLTNYPTFDWHLTNLGNYISLKAINAAPVDLSNMVINAPGQGSGLLGIPGDWTPPSRFIRIATFKEFVVPAKNSEEAMNLASQLLYTVNIPLGDIRSKAGKDASVELTQWVVIKDLTNKIFYYHTYQDLTWHKIDMNKLNLKPGDKTVTLPMSTTQHFIDDTASFGKS